MTVWISLLEVVQVGLDDLVDQRVLDLDRHPPAVAQGAEVDLADRGGGEGLEVELLEEIVEVLQRAADLVLHHLGRHPRRLLLQRAQHLGHLGRQQALVEAQHLADLHGGALELAQGLDDPCRVADQVLGRLELPGWAGAGEVRDPVPHDRNPDPAGETAELEESPDGRGGELVVSHGLLVPRHGRAAARRAGCTGCGPWHCGRRARERGESRR